MQPSRNGQDHFPIRDTRHQPILLRDVIEQKLESPAVKEQVREMQREGQAVIDNESRELLAIHHTGFIAAEAGQICRGYTNSDH